MGWASHYIAKLKNGDTVSFRPRGNSMSGKIESGQLCTVKPVDPINVEVGDIVLCGESSAGRLLVVIFTERGTKIRIISSREATRAERKQYEEGDF